MRTLKNQKAVLRQGFFCFFFVFFPQLVYPYTSSIVDWFSFNYIG